MVDLFENQASASSAIINLVRCLLGAVGTSTIEPMIQKLGIGWSFTLLAGFCILALPLVVAHYRYGHSWREKRSLKLVEKTRVQDKKPVQVPSPNLAPIPPTYSFINHHVADSQVFSLLTSHCTETGVPVSYMIFVLFMGTYRKVFTDNSKFHFTDPVGGVTPDDISPEKLAICLL